MDKCIDCSTDVSRYGTKRCLDCYNKVRKGIYNRSYEFKNNLSVARRGSNNPFFGKRHSVETRLRWSNERSGQLNPFYGKRGLACPNYGENNPNWRGGVTSLVRQIRTCAKYAEWRTLVFLRDRFECRICGKCKVYLESHHCSTSFVDLIREFNITTVDDAVNCNKLWDIDNGLTLCSDCHCLIDKSRRRFG